MKLARVSDISEGKAIAVGGPRGQEIALFKIEGEIFALDNACPHAGGPLAEGEIRDHCVTCPWHAWDFDIRTGACLNMPGIDALSLPLVVKGEEIYLADAT